jgi:hypothetical protein
MSISDWRFKRRKIAINGNDIGPMSVGNNAAYFR